MRKPKKIHYCQHVIRYSVFGTPPEFFVHGYILSIENTMTFIELDTPQSWQTRQAAEEDFIQLAKQRIHAVCLDNLQAFI